MLLSKEKIIVNLKNEALKHFAEIHCFESVDSTNRWLFDRAQSNNIHGCVCLADSQTCGVGRGGKSWVASASKNILMSMGYQFDLELAKLSSLSLVVGVGMVNALKGLGVEGLSLKWPNDVYLNGTKLAGILIQTQKHPLAGNWAIIGIGLNIQLAADDKKNIEQPVAELSSLGFKTNQREMIIATLIDELLPIFEQFNHHGFGLFIERWSELDCLKGRNVILTQTDQQISGRYLGVNPDGSLRIALPNNQIKEYYVGELSLRKIVDK